MQADPTYPGSIASRGSPLVICVLGMHRSGTSSLAGCLEEAGVDLGEVHRWSPWNAKGNRESQAIMDLHEDVLAASGGSWDHPPERVTWLHEHRRRRDQIIASHERSAVWGFKDPRTLLTVDGWLEALPDLRFVATFRHPLAVASSLRRRAGGEGDLAPWLELWVDYNRRLLDLRARRDMAVVNFDLEPPAYRAQIVAAVAALGLTPPASGFTFFEPSLRTQTAGDDALSPAAREVYEALRAAAS